MKLRKLFASIALMTTLTIGVGFAVAGNHKEEVKPAEAASVFNDALVYLDTSFWKSGNNDERYAVYYATSSGDGWYSMIKVGTDFYGARLPKLDITLIIFCRMNGATSENNWNNKWNQSNDITTYSPSTCVYKVTSWAGEKNPGAWQSNSGYTSSFDSRYVSCKDNGWSANDNGYKMTVDITKAEGRLEKAFSATSLAFKVTNGTWDGGGYGVGYVESGTDSNYIDLSEGGNNNIGLKVEGSYEIYWKYIDQKIWAQVSSSTEADVYAESFLATIECKPAGGVDFDINAWNKVGEATTSMEYKYEQLTSGARNYLTGLTPNQSGSKSEQCVARYDRILGKYGYGTGSGQYHDFMGRTPAPQASARLVFGQISNNNAAIIVVVVSMIGVASLAGYYFFKKRKHESD